VDALKKASSNRMISVQVRGDGIMQKGLKVGQARDRSLSSFSSSDSCICMRGTIAVRVPNFWGLPRTNFHVWDFGIGKRSPTHHTTCSYSGARPSCACDLQMLGQIPIGPQTFFSSRFLAQLACGQTWNHCQGPIFSRIRRRANPCRGRG
jgi:hypothetical protein